MGYVDGLKGSRGRYDPVAMFKVLILAVRHTVSDDRMEFLIHDRLSWLRFVGFELGAPTPDRNTIGTFGERLTKAGGANDLFLTFERALREAGLLAMGRSDRGCNAGGGFPAALGVVGEVLWEGLEPSTAARWGR